MIINLIYPNQLFEDLSLMNSENKTILLEDFLFFKKYKFHKQKILLHRLTLKNYEKYLQENNFKTQYIESICLEDRNALGKILEKIGEQNKQSKIEKVVTYEIVDEWQKKDLEKAAKELDFEIEYVKNNMFINSTIENKKFFTKPDGTYKKPFMKTFYEWQRNRLNILMHAEKKPIGGKYSFDEENRKKLPKDYAEPENVNFAEKYKDDKVLLEAKKYVENNFIDNYGEVKNFNYATNFKDAKKVLHNFLENKLQDFGVYEDSISSKINFVNHSILTPYLNIGLLTPKYVIEETLKFAKAQEKTDKEIPLNSLEGFLRQIIGWREFMRAMYEIYGSKMRSTNFFKHHKKLESFWWTGEVEIEGINMFPINNSIKSVLNNAYNHHIERLMILGNFMLLCEYDPNDIYKWFMEMYIDSYDWVMVPNVYCMSQFADGGIFATKPYISGSNYIFKMSDYKKIKSESNSWDKVWDIFFWNFLKKHRTFFEKNIRFKMLLNRVK